MIRVLPLGTAKLCSLSPLTRMSSCSSPPPDSTYPLMFHTTPLDLVVSTLFFFSWIGWLNRLIFALAHTWDFTPRTTMGRTPWRLNSAGPHGFFTPNRYLHTLQVVSVSSTIAVIFFFSCHIKIPGRRKGRKKSDLPGISSELSGHHFGTQLLTASEVHPGFCLLLEGEGQEI